MLIRTIAVIVTVGLAMGLGGCDSVRKIPWVGDGVAKLQGGDATAEPKIVVIPLQGTEWPGRAALAQQMATQLSRPGGAPVAAAEIPKRTAQTVAGRLEGEAMRDSVVWLAIRWEYRDVDGTLIGSHHQLSVIDGKIWRAGAPQAVSLMLADAVPGIARIMSAHEGPSAIATAGLRAAPQASAPTPSLAPSAGRLSVLPAPYDNRGSIATAVPPPQAQVQAAPPRQAQARAPYKPPELPLSGYDDTANRAVPPAPLSVPADMASPPPAIPSAPEPPRISSGAAAAAAAPPGLPAARSVERPRAYQAPVPITAAAWSAPVLAIQGVSGAPGDGNRTLARAIREALRLRDFQVTDDPRQAAFRLMGQVDMTQPNAGRQHVKITWRVTTMNGGNVGRATQENTIPAGSLDGSWGQVADMIGNAAVDGIQELFGQRPSGRGRDAAGMPPPASLPAQPGRAPPPR